MIDVLAGIAYLMVLLIIAVIISIISLHIEMKNDCYDCEYYVEGEVCENINTCCGRCMSTDDSEGDE